MAEQPCYTLINNPSETEIPNEQQLRSDLGEYERTAVTYSNYRPLSLWRRARRQQSEGGSSQEGDTAGSERGASPWATHGDNSVRVAVQRSPDQEVVATRVGDMAQDVAGREAAARDDLSLRCLPQGKETLSLYGGHISAQILRPIIFTMIIRQLSLLKIRGKTNFG